MRKQLFILGLVVAFVFAAAAPKVFAQGAVTGSISGVVTDPQGAFIPGAAVKIISVDTGIERDTVSNDAGLFTMPRLAPGKYIVRVSKQGFRLQEFREVTVKVAEDTALASKLELGSVTESIVVEAATPLVEANTAQTSNTFDQKKIGELPAVGNGLDAVALLAPGVIRGFGNVNSNGVTLSVNGQRSRSNNFTIDGQDNNDNTIGGPGLFLSIIDVVKEFTIITNNFSAEYGRNQGAIVNIVTKGGTNVIHGSLHGSHQNSRLNANTFDNNRDGIVKPRFNDNRDAGAIGGPFKKDKAFFFFYLSSDQSKSISTNTSGGTSFVITPNGLATIISHCGVTNTLAAYRDHGPFAQSIGNPAILPGSASTTRAQSQYTPLSTGDPCGGAPFSFETARVTRNTPTPTNEYDWGMKYDFNLSSKNTVNFRYLFQDGVTKNSNGSSAGYEIDVPFRSQNLGVTFTRQLSSRQVNEVRFNYGRLAVSFEGANTFPFAQIDQNIARMTMPSGFLSFGLATNLPQNRLVRTWQWADNWTLQVGRHTLKAGADVRRQLTPTGFLPQVNGAFTFSANSPTVPGVSASRGISNFVRNTPSLFNGAAGDKVLNIKETDLFLYFQDDFKIRPNFTLNLGIRYEYTGQPLNVVHDITVARESNASTAFFNPALPLSARTVPELAAPKKNFAPRFGFAYTPRWGQWLFGQDKTVIRGGYSIAYDPAFFNLLLNVSTAAPTVFLYTKSLPTVPANITGARLATVFLPPVGTQDPRLLNQTQFDTSFRSPYAENWTFGIQRQVRPTLAFEVRYAGSRGVRLYQTRNGNPLVSGFISSGFGSLVPSGITAGPVSGRADDTFRLLRIRGNTAASTYHGLQSRLDGRLRNQLTLGLSYTYSHNIDNVSEVFGFITGSPTSGVGSIAIAQNPFNINKGERGNSNIDLRHAIATNFIWDVPAFKSQHGAVGHVLGGWTLSGVYRWYTGRPMTPVCFSCGNPVTDTLMNATFFGYLDATRPFLSNPSAPTGSTGTFTSTSSSSLVDFNTGAATTPDKVQWIINNANAAAIFGTPFGVSRNPLFGPRFNRGDAALYKNIKISERYSVQIRAEAQNVFNTPFLGSPDLFIDDGSPTFLNSAASASSVFPRTVTVGILFSF